MSRVPQNRSTNFTVHVCPICGKKKVHNRPAWMATEKLEDAGWTWTTQITEDDSWHLVCPKHRHPQHPRLLFFDGSMDEEYKGMKQIETPIEDPHTP